MPRGWRLWLLLALWAFFPLVFHPWWLLLLSIASCLRLCTIKCYIVTKHGLTHDPHKSRSVFNNPVYQGDVVQCLTAFTSQRRVEPLFFTRSERFGAALNNLSIFQGRIGWQRHVASNFQASSPFRYPRRGTPIVFISHPYGGVVPPSGITVFDMGMIEKTRVSWRPGERYRNPRSFACDQPRAEVAAAKTKKFSELVTEWKANEGAALGRATMAHYTNALRADVIPTFGDHDIQTINRKSIQSFLAKQAKKYSRSSLRSMRLVLCMTLGWAEKNGEIQQPNA